MGLNRRSAVLTSAGTTAVLALAAVALTGPSQAATPHGAGTDDRSIQAPGRAVATMPLSVMTQNMFYGGDDYDLETGGFCRVANGCPKALHRLAHIVDVSGTDILGVQEPERNTAKLARMLGWYASPRAHVISRYPILDPPGSRGVFVFIEVAPGQVVAMANVHLPSTPYGPYEFRDGATRAEVRHLELGLRMPWIRDALDKLPRLAARGVPVFLTGDFNSPSHLDWTKPVAQVRDDVPYPFRWPVSVALAHAGFADSYRDVHPDPVARPGFTWTPGGPETDPHEVFDRIDWVLHAGPAATTASRLVGEDGGPDVDLGLHPPYPTDHRGVVSTFDVTPAPAPVLVSPSDRRVTIGDDLTVDFHAPGHAGERVAILATGTAGAHHAVVSRPSTGTGGAVVVPTDRLKERGYDVALLSQHGRVLSRAAIWAYEPTTRPTITSVRDSYRVGETLRFRWTGAPGEGLDWIGLYPCHRRGCAGVGGYLLYDYTHTRIVGSESIDARDTWGEGAVGWPVPPGRYIARLLVDDSYVSVARSARFRVG